ncbi:MAG: type II secretion system major pseudopilin GspG [Nitrospina sp.]|jgi:general secretion pathway protein G|nr:type II secretion system major pseudopilin GspG [Nitrospina sp.]MBT6600554.1 type II secretion system major pseudopilin GspG [Nitrospina sp.]
MNRQTTIFQVKKNLQSGFTLIELLVVMVIIGLLAALVVPKFFGHVDKAMQQDAQAQIELLGQALDLYRLENHKYPNTEEGLKAISAYLKKEIPKDPWGNSYIYTSPGEHGDYDLISYGADKVEGGEENNKDIVSWK